MVSKSARSGKSTQVAVLAVLCFMIAGASLVYLKTDLFRDASPAQVGLSGLVSVRGSVSLEHLALSPREIKAINKVVNAHKGTFTKVDMVVDAVGQVDEVKDSTVLVFAMALKTNGDLEIKSWSRKVKRSVLVDQMVSYMYKAAKEYDEFQKFPDVKQNFKTLYI